MNVRYLVDTESNRVLTYWHDSCLNTTHLDPIVRKNLILLEEDTQVEPALHLMSISKSTGLHRLICNK